MFEQVLPGKTKEYLALLAKGTFPPDTYLAGGTAVALHLGHRISYDLDFFSSKKFNVERVLDTLKNIDGFKIQRTDWQTILGDFPDCKFSLFYYQYPLIKKPQEFFGVKIASLKDLSASKIGAISSRGTKRDFIDLYYILRSGNSGSLISLLDFYDQRFANLASQRTHILKSLIYFTDAEKEGDPRMLVKDYSWGQVKQYLSREVLKITKDFK